MRKHETTNIVVKKWGSMSKCTKVDDARENLRHCSEYWESIEKVEKSNRKCADNFVRGVQNIEKVCKRCEKI